MSASWSSASYSERGSAQVAQLEIEEISQARARAAKTASVRAVTAACVCFAKSQRESGTAHPVFVPLELHSLLLEYVGVAPLGFSAGFVPAHEVFPRRMMDLCIGWHTKEILVHYAHAGNKRRPQKAAFATKAAPAPAPGTSLLQRGYDFLSRLSARSKAEKVDPSAPTTKTLVYSHHCVERYMTFVTDFRKFERFLPSCYRDGPGEVYGWQTTNVDKCNCSGALVYRLDVRGSPVLVEAFRGTPADKGTGYRVPVQLPTFGAKRPTFHPKALRHLWISAAELNDRDGTYTFCFGDHNDLPREFEIEVRRGTPFQHQTRLLHGDRLRTEERADNEKSRAVVWLDVYISPELFFDDYKYGDARTPEQIKADQEASVSIVLGGDVAEAILRDHEDEFVVEDEEDEVEVDLFVYLDVARILWYCEKKSGPDDFAAVTDVTCEWKHCEIGEMDATHGEMSEMGGECVRSEFISAATILGVPIISSRVKKNARGTGLVPEVAATPPAQAVP